MSSNNVSIKGRRITRAHYNYIEDLLFGKDGMEVELDYKDLADGEILTYTRRNGLGLSIELEVAWDKYSDEIVFTCY